MLDWDPWVWDNPQIIKTTSFPYEYDNETNCNSLDRSASERNKDIRFEQNYHNWETTGKILNNWV